jgi:hypothetical protein
VQRRILFDYFANQNDPVIKMNKVQIDCKPQNRSKSFLLQREGMHEF